MPAYLIAYRYTDLFTGLNQIEATTHNADRPIRTMADVDAVARLLTTEGAPQVVVLAFSELPGEDAGAAEAAKTPRPALSVGDRVVFTANISMAGFGTVQAGQKGTITHFIYPYAVVEDDAQGLLWQALDSEIEPLGAEDNKYKTTLGAFIEALQIFAANLRDGLDATYVLSAEHDEIFGISADAIAENSAPGRRLTALGWHIDEDANAWSRFV